MDQAIVSPTLASPVVELRQYTLHPGKRDTLLTLFEDKFVTGLEAAGQRLHGEFRDAKDPDRYVWIRGFSDMADRPRALEAFYGGPLWKANRDAANATMIDSDNVLLLQPVDKPGFTLAKRMTSLMVATIYLLQAPVDATFERFFAERVRPVMAATGAPPVAELRTLYAANNYPRLPIREGENAYVTIAAFETDAEYQRHLAKLDASAEWKSAQAELTSKLKSLPQRLELNPTAKSLKRNATPFVYSLGGTGDMHDFDFLPGSWTAINRRLTKRNPSSNEWDEFLGHQKAQILMGGVVNVDEVEFRSKGWSGVTFRNFDKEKRQWSIYWVNSRDGRMTSPVYGGFDGDIGLFYGDDEDGGQPIRVVYKWTKVGPSHARWEQAFSYDDGKTWETNWKMEMTKQ